MNRLSTWFCLKRQELMRWSLIIAVLAPVAAWSISRAYAVDARSIIVGIGAALFAVWRPYRDSWLRVRCATKAVCA
jgi:hypothetical protein